MISNDEDERAPRPIDDAFWAAWLACEAACLTYALHFFPDEESQRALDLRDAAFDAILDGSRPWREGTELVDHMKGCMKSIHWNESINISVLALRQTEEDEDPDPANDRRSPEEEAIDNERGNILQSVVNDILAKAREGSLEKKYLLECAKGVDDVKKIAKNLGVTVPQISDVRKTVRRKANEILKKRGYALSDEEVAASRRRRKAEEEDDDDGDES
jgi:hypothetical protein